MVVEVPLKLPYYARHDRLPSPLPSVADINAASEKLSTKRDDRSIVRVGSDYIVKYGKYLRSIEAENMIFVKQSCGISVPEVYAVFEDDMTGVIYIIMEFIHGQTLDHLWKSLDDIAKEDISMKLRAQIEDLRRIPSQGYYGTLGRRPYWDQIFSALEQEAQARICGPFETEEQLVEGIVQRYLVDHPQPQRAYYLRRVLPTVLSGHTPHFTHSDLQRKNIIIGDNDTPYIIDWEEAAWYPDCWEYFRTMVSFGRYSDDWHKWVGKILTEYTHEFAWLEFIRYELLF